MRKALQHLRQADPVIGGLIEALGSYRIEYSPPEFSTIVRCIIYQQLSGKVALTIYKRLEAALGGGRGMTPAAVLALSVDSMRRLGLSGRKVEYIRDFAQGCVSNEIDLAPLHSMEDAEVMRRLTGRRGIGPWTVHMYLIFALRRPDVLPVGDLGVRAAVRNVYGLEATPPPAEVARLGEPWRPYATVATWYLWRSLGDGGGLDPEV